MKKQLLVALLMTVTLLVGSSGHAAGNLCGNGKIDPGEQCDKSNLNGATCQTVVPNSCGVLSCFNCKFSTIACVKMGLNPCMTDSCVSNKVVHTNNTNSCDDKSLCTKNDICSSGKCTGTPVAILDTNACTIDKCDPVAGVTHTMKPGLDDGNICTTDKCDPKTGDFNHLLIPVNDENACTVDSYNPSSGIIHTQKECPAAGQRCDPQSGACKDMCQVTATAITAKQDRTCGVMKDGTVKCWGRNVFGQLGDGTTVDKLLPTPVSGLAGVTDLAVGKGHACALLTNNSTVKCWGNNGNGQLGDGTKVSKLIPTTPVAGLTGVAALTAGSLYTCALLADGTAKCWGSNGNGQLGDGTKVDKLVPTPVAGLSGVTALATTNEHTCALLQDGTVQCWGWGAWYGNENDSPLPTPVVGLEGVTALATGDNFACALLQDGTVQCWGSNLSGQLGDGTTVNQLSPSTIAALTGATDLALEDNYACGLFADGAVRCWGSNEYGQLGDGTTVSKLTPTPVKDLCGTPTAP